jgi:hypothetical protein
MIKTIYHGKYSYHNSFEIDLEKSTKTLYYAPLFFEGKKLNPSTNRILSSELHNNKVNIELILDVENIAKAPNIIYGFIMVSKSPIIGNSLITGLRLDREQKSGYFQLEKKI